MKIIDDLKKHRTEEVGRFLTSVYTEEPDSKVRKAIRKSLFVLKTAGVEVEDLPTPGEESVLRRVEQERRHRGFMSNFDSESTRLILAIMERKRNSFVVVEAISHLFHGLVELMTVPASGPEMENILAGYRAKTTVSIRLNEISPKFALYLLTEEAGRSGKFTEEARQLKQFSTSVKGSVQRPGDILSLAIPEGTQPSDLTAIMGSSIFEPLDLAWDGIAEDRKDFQDIGTGTLVLPQYMVEEKKEGFIASFLQSDKGKLLEARIRRILEDYAYMLHVERDFRAYRGLVETLREPRAVSGAITQLVKKTLEKTEVRAPGLIVSPP